MSNDNNTVEILAPVIERFRRFENLKALHDEAGTSGQEALGPLVLKNQQLLEEMFDHAGVGEALKQYNDDYNRDQKVLGNIVDHPVEGLDEEYIQKYARSLDERTKTPLHRLAEYFGSWALDQSYGSEQYDNTDRFLLEPVESVAEKLIGLRLFVGSKSAEIISTQAQSREKNVKHQKRPIFGNERVDIYAGPAQGGRYMLFVRAGAVEDLACVRIAGIKAGDGSLIETPTGVAKWFDVSQQMVGNLLFDGSEIRATFDPLETKN